MPVLRQVGAPRRVANVLFLACLLAAGACGDDDPKAKEKDAAASEAADSAPNDDEPSNQDEEDAAAPERDSGTQTSDMDAQVAPEERDAASASDAAIYEDAQLDAAPQDAGPSRVVLASGQHAPTGIAVNSTFVYFASRDDGTIMRCPHSGCGTQSPELIVTGADHPIALALDATHLYWVTGYRNGETGAPSSRPVYRCPLADCSAPNREAIDRGTLQPYAIAVSDSALYFASWPRLARCPKAGCTSGLEEIGSGPYVSVVPESDALYAARYGQRAVVRCPATGCASATVIVPDVFPIGIASDPDHLYIADYNALGIQSSALDGGVRPARVLRCKKPDCAGGVEALEEGDMSPYGIASYADRVYFTNVDHGTVISLRK